MDRVVLETTFLIDLEREIARETVGPARGFLTRHADLQLCISPISAGEMACGPLVTKRDVWQRFLTPFLRLDIDDTVCWHFGEIVRYLRANGLLIGTNDLWIASCALARDLPVVTRNTKHFERVPGLRVIGY